MAEAGGEPTFRRAVVLMTVTSFLVPAAGVVTAPLLARALSTDGRGELAAALAPAGLTLAAATLGLPDALTFFLAKRPSLTRSMVSMASVITVLLGIVCVAATALALPFLQDGDPGLGRLILLAVALTVPSLVVNVLRGAATGRQMWRAVAIERLVNTAARVVVFGALFAVDRLTVLNAVLVSVITPLVSGLVYVGLFRSSELVADPVVEPVPVSAGATTGDNEVGVVGVVGAGASGEVGVRRVLDYGARVWFGSVASMMLSRSALLLMAPLAGVEALGIYSVATTVSDLPLIVALAIQGALFGVNARTADAQQVTATSRLTLLAAAVGCLVMGLSLPLWIGLLFGEEFRSATVPTLMLMASALLCIPGLMAATGLAAWGRPGLRSIGLGVTLVANVVLFVVLVPWLGVIGACWTSLLSNVVMTSFMVGACQRVMGVRAHTFLLIGRADVRRAVGEGTALLSRLSRRKDVDPVDSVGPRV